MNKFLKQYPRFIPLKEGMTIKLLRDINLIANCGDICLLGKRQSKGTWLIRIGYKDHYISIVVPETDFEVYVE